MIFMKRTIYILVAVMVGTLTMSLNSCKTPKMRVADEAYERGEFYDASNIYRKIYNKLSHKEDRWLRGEVAYKMGLCYRRLNQSSRAEAAFVNALRYEYEEDSTIYLYLAQAQHMNGKWKDARQNYEKYLTYVPDDYVSQQGIRACDMAPKWKEDGSRYTVKLDKMFNSRRADFCPQYLGADFDQIFFTSSTEKATGETKSEITGTKRSDIFFSKKDEKGKWTRPQPVEGDLNTEWDEGVTSFSPDGSTMYLAKVIRKADGPSAVEIYTSTRSEAKWGAAAKFDITADTLSSYGDPAVSADGNWLYFTSDMPGGYGGLDLWRINIKDRIGTLQNMGGQINTPGDERFPFCRTDSLLYFSSNGHAGFGGLDLFRAALQPSGKWFIQNMGAPMNSSADDFGITYGKGETGFFSSNRKDARGYDKIYTFEKPELKVWISGYVLDKDEEPVPNAVIRIVGDDGSNQKAAANPDGSFRFDLERGVKYVMLAGANGYMNSQQQFESDLEEADAEYYVDFVLAAMMKPQVVENIFYDFDKASLRPASKKALDDLVKTLNENPYVTIELSAHTDRVGSDQYNDGLSQRRAQSVVDYLVKHGIDMARLKPQGYGKRRPKVVTKRINRLYPQFAVGDTLNVERVDTLSKEDKAAADQINRRTEFMVLSTNFQPFAEDLKRMREEAERLKAEAEERGETFIPPAYLQGEDKKDGTSSAAFGTTVKNPDNLDNDAEALKKKEMEKAGLDPDKESNKPDIGGLSGPGMKGGGNNSGNNSGSGSGRGSGNGSGNGSRGGNKGSDLDGMTPQQIIDKARKDSKKGH